MATYVILSRLPSCPTIGTASTIPPRTPFREGERPVRHHPARGAVSLDLILFVGLKKFIVDEKRLVTITDFTGKDVRGHGRVIF